MGAWFYAFNVLALCLAAVPFAFGTLRSGGLGKRLFIGIVFALGSGCCKPSSSRRPASTSSTSALPTCCRR